MKINRPVIGRAALVAIAAYVLVFILLKGRF